MALDLVTIEHGPHPEGLTQPAKAIVFPLSAEETALISEMKAMLIKLKGVGLAAPQVGTNKQIIVYSINEDAKVLRNANEAVPMTVLINPYYQPTEDAQIVYDWEACFSVAEKSGKVPRYDKIKYFAKTEDGQCIEALAEGFTARVLQHEIDHIQGILIIHRLTPDCIQGHPDKMMAIRISEMSPAQKEAMQKIVQLRMQTDG